MTAPSADYVPWPDDEPDDGERDCIDCGESFNLGDGGQDWNTTAGGSLCLRCEDKWPTTHNDSSGASIATRDCSECGAEKGMPHGKFCAYNEGRNDSSETTDG